MAACRMVLSLQVPRCAAALSHAPGRHSTCVLPARLYLPFSLNERRCLYQRRLKTRQAFPGTIQRPWAVRRAATLAPRGSVTGVDQEILEENRSGVEEETRCPVTVLTGYLGSGKTTLLNHVLTAEHGKRVAVIENEFGEVDIDGSLVAAQRSGTEDLVMLNNGCLCCTVRGDLVRMLATLVTKRRDHFDHILIETTGLANPAPIIQTFYLEPELEEHLYLDGIVTVVDSKYAMRHMDEERPEGIINETVEQIAFADRIVLNKVDLVDDKEIRALTQRVKRINSMAQVRTAKQAIVDMDFVLGIGGFDLERVVDEINADFLKAEEKHDHHNHDHDHKHDHDHDHEHCDKCGHAHADGEHDHDHDHNHDHGGHDPGVRSVSLVREGELDLEKVNDWLSDFLGERHPDLYRMKGVLAIKGCKERFVFQGVHAMFEGLPERPWNEGERRINKIVFIGRDLDKDELEKGFQECFL